MEPILKAIQEAKSVVLSTHRQCDGDGLGAEMAMYFALRNAGKNARIVNVDETPRKYRYLNPDQYITYFEQNENLRIEADLCLIFDTNDQRLIEPLFSKALRPGCKQIIFIDHHPILKHGPHPGANSLIDTSAASTGELAYRMIKALGYPIDANVARALYTSITFDTQLYRYIRNSPNSHRIAAELLEHPIDPTMVHRHLFGNQTVQKMAFLAKALGQIEYFCDGQLAVLKLRDADLFHYNLEPDESRDVIDMLMNIETLEAAALFREDSPNEYKVSLRSKGRIEVLSVAEAIGGGGHIHAAGATVRGSYEEMKVRVVNELTKKLAAMAG